MLSFKPTFSLSSFTFIKRLFSSSSGKMVKESTSSQMVKESTYKAGDPCIAGFNPWKRKILWKREWLPTPVLLPGEYHRQRSRADYSPWGHKESYMTELLTHTHTHTHTNIYIYMIICIHLWVIYLYLCKHNMS